MYRRCPAVIKEYPDETVKEKLGGLHSAKCILYSVDFAEIEEMRGVAGLLASKASSFMTGSAVVVDGGQSCW